MRFCVFCVMGAVALLGLAGCGSLKPKPVTQPFLQSVRQIQPDGSVVTAKEKEVSPFQSFMRERILTGRALEGKKKAAWSFGPARIRQAVLLEADVPASEEGYEGAYMAVLLFSDGTARLEYYEQADHGPRYDRYFHRELTAAERNALLAFLKVHPVETLRADTAPKETTGAEIEAAQGLMFRITDATAKQATSVLVPDAGTAAGTGALPSMELVRLFGALRDAAEPPLVCTYFRAIPVDAAVLFASPTRRVVNVWAKDDDVRILVADASEEAKWWALRGGGWMETAAPTEEMQLPSTVQAAAAAGVRPSAATQALVPAEHRPVVAATVPAATKGEPVFPRLPRPATTAELLARMESRPEPLPTKEGWYAQRRQGHTVFTHYLPRAAGPGGVMPQGESVQVIIPGLEFDSGHMAMAEGMLYVVHEGQLIRMPVPAAVSGSR